MATEIKLIQSKTEKLLYSIGQQLRAAREEKKMTREDLEEFSGVSVSTIKRVENGGSIHLDNVIRMSMALEIDLEMLIYG